MKKIHALLLLAPIVGCTVSVRNREPPPPPPVAVAPPAPPPPPAPRPAAPPPATGSGGSVGAGVAGAVGGISASAAAQISWGNFLSPTGERPNTTCRKESDKELCYDAVDNNCDGQIDEGCPGYRTTNNHLQFMIAWKVAVDLDLHVVGPDGKEVNFKARDSGTLVLDKDCTGLKNGVDNCPEGKVENVFFPADRAILRGRYKVWVELADPRGQKDPQVPFFFGGKVGAQTFFVPFFVANKRGERKAFEFDVI
jgi:tRNA (guanosine-2'-O-)-methyltransferase